MNFFSTFFLDRNLKVKNLIIMVVKNLVIFHVGFDFICFFQLKVNQEVNRLLFEVFDENRLVSKKFYDNVKLKIVLK